jgi:diphosphomevalonate decarboxylase
VTTAVAQGHPNIAFIKYWGNVDHALRLPANSSISMNLKGVETETRVTWDDRLPADVLVLNGREETGDALTRVAQHLDVLRKRLGLEARAQVETRNNFPTGAGIASSAAAFAALTVAGVAAAGATLTERELTTLARLGSGSASRSVPSGFVEWHAASTHDDSYAETAFAPDYWALVDVIAVISRAHKATGSTAGHRSADTSDLQTRRVAGAATRLAACKAAIAAHDFAAFGEVVEHDSNLMHAVMMTSRPPLFYWLPGSLALMERVRQLRHEGLRVCYTLDAGPNVHCICVREDADKVRAALSSMSEIGEIIVASVGGGARVTERA